MSWKERWIARRNRILAAPAFQDTAARLPGLRFIARRRAAGLFDLLAGFTYSQILLAAEESGLLDLLAKGPASTDDLAAGAALSRPAAERLLRACGALDLAEQCGTDRWMLGGTGAVLQAHPGARAMIRHHRLLYADLSEPLALLRADRTVPTALSRFWAYGERHAAEDAYSELMAASQAAVAREVLSAHDFGRHRALLDIGGGNGAFASAVAARHPHLRIAVFDLPGVIASARPDPAIALHPGSFLADPLPRGFDCLSLVRILHDHDDAAALTLLRAADAALEDGGVLVIAEPMAGTGPEARVGDAYFGLYLWAMGQGRPRRPAEIGRLLEQAGFTSWRERKTAMPLNAALIVASK